MEYNNIVRYSPVWCFRFVGRYMSGNPGHDLSTQVKGYTE